MRIFLFVLIGFALFWPSLLAAEDVEKTSFEEALSAYEEAKLANDNTATFKYAKLSYTLGAEKFGAKNIQMAALSANLGKLIPGPVAVQLMQQSLDIQIMAYGGHSLELVQAYIDLATSYSTIISFRKRDRAATEALARENFDRAVSIVQRHHGSDSFQTGIASLQIGKTATQKFKRAWFSGELAYPHLDIAEKIFLSSNHAEAATKLAWTKYWQGRHHLNGEENSRAVTDFTEAFNIFTRIGAATKNLITIQKRLVEGYEKLGQQDQATKICMAISGLTHSGPERDEILVYRPEPIYPTHAMERGNQGTVTVEYTVNSQGIIVAPKVVEITGDDAFQKAALKAAAKTRYAPRFENGVPVAAKNVQTKFTFQLAS